MEMVNPERIIDIWEMFWIGRYLIYGGREAAAWPVREFSLTESARSKTGHLQGFPKLFSLNVKPQYKASKHIGIIF